MESRCAREIWEAALGELQVQVSKQNYRTWLEKTVGLSLQDSQLVVGVPSTFVAEYLDKKQRSLIEKTLISVTSRSITKAVFQVNNGSRNLTGDDSAPGKFPAVQTNSSMLNPKYTFGSFVTGKCNQLAYSAAISISENPARNYNPLFIYGGVGLGKTHLMQAIGHAALAKGMKILYVSAERFTNEFIAAISEHKSGAFHNKYRNVDMLLIDDIQFISGKEQTEESFFHTFNELHNSSHQVAITSNQPPKSLKSLPNRLRSRFEGGLVVNIQPPDFETRLAILQAKAERQGAKIPLDSLEFVAQQAEQNIRELEGLLNRIIAYSRLVQAPVTLELVAKATEDIASPAHIDTSIDPTLLIEAVASSFHLHPSELKTRKRAKEIALARQMAMYLIRNETSCSLAQIGTELGGRDHSTVIHACEKIADEVKENPYLKRKLIEIRRVINSGQRGDNL